MQRQDQARKSCMRKKVQRAHMDLEYVGLLEWVHVGLFDLEYVGMFEWVIYSEYVGLLIGLFGCIIVLPQMQMQAGTSAGNTTEKPKGCET